MHRLRNLEPKAPKHAFTEPRVDFHRIVYAESAAAARVASCAFGLVVGGHIGLRRLPR
jgi:hypothetical protein